MLLKKIQTGKATRCWTHNTCSKVRNVLQNYMLHCLPDGGKPFSLFPLKKQQQKHFFYTLQNSNLKLYHYLPLRFLCDRFILLESGP